VKKTLKKILAWQPKTLLGALVVAFAKFAMTVLVGLGISAGFWWAFTHDETSVEAQKVWAEQAKELDSRIEFQKAHPKVVFEF